MFTTWRDKYKTYVFTDVLFSVLVLITGLLAQFNSSSDYRLIGFGFLSVGLLSVGRFICEYWILR